MSAPKSISGSENGYRKWTHYFRFISFWPILSLKIYNDLLFSRKPFFPNIPGQFIAHRPSVVLRHPSVSCACQENSSCAFRDAIIIFFIYVYNLYSPSSVVIFFFRKWRGQFCAVLVFIPETETANTLSLGNCFVPIELNPTLIWKCIKNANT